MSKSTRHGTVGAAPRLSLGADDPWNQLPFVDDQGGLRVELDGVRGAYTLDRDQYRAAVSLLFAIAAAAARLTRAQVREAGFAGTYGKLPKRLARAARDAQRVSGALAGRGVRASTDALVTVVEPLVGALAILAGWQAESPPSLSTLIETALPRLGFQIFRADILARTGKDWSDTSTWPSDVGPLEHALHVVLPARNEEAHAAPEHGTQQARAAWMTIVAIAAAASAADLRGGWVDHLEAGRMLSITALASPPASARVRLLVAAGVIVMAALGVAAVLTFRGPSASDDETARFVESFGALLTSQLLNSLARASDLCLP